MPIRPLVFDPEHYPEDRIRVPMRGSQVVFSSEKDNWQTPTHLFVELHKEFGFTIDGAADTTNHLLSRWLGPGGLVEDALTTSWAGERLFINCPYSMVKEFVAKGFEERYRSLSVFLVPARTDTRWWHNHVWSLESHGPRDRVSVRFLKGRVKFVNPDGIVRNGHSNSAPFPSAVIVFG